MKKRLLTLAIGFAGLLAVCVITYISIELVSAVLGSFDKLTYLLSCLLPLVWLTKMYRAVTRELGIDGFEKWLFISLIPALICLAAAALLCQYAKPNDKGSTALFLIFTALPVWFFAVISGLYEAVKKVGAFKKDGQAQNS